MDEIYKFITKVQSIAKIGKVFSKDPYALENYEELEKISREALENYSGEKLLRDNIFVRDIYPTPSISCRALILNSKQEILLVKEAKTKNWSLPGGWCDLYESPSQAIIKECRQEAGVDIEISRLLCFTDRRDYLEPNAVSEYTVCFLCQVVKDYHEHCHETTDVKYFALDALPELSHKYRLEELKKALEAYKTGKVYFN